MANVNVIGIRCGLPADAVIKHFRDLGGDVILLEPMCVCGRDHILSAVMHAERAFARGTNRSKTLLTETILYAAGERQISKALAKMRPGNGCGKMVAVVFDVNDPQLDRINAVADESLVPCTPDKAKHMGLCAADNVSIEDLALEMVAMVDLQKQ